MSLETITIRVETDVKKKLKNMADKAKRSLTSEIALILERAVKK